jgi:hypothetical protein
VEKVLLEKLLVAQLLKKFAAFYETRAFTAIPQEIILGQFNPVHTVIPGPILHSVQPNLDGCFSLNA